MGFDERAADWDTPERIARAKQIAGAISEALGDRTRGRLLEYGCGTGLVGLHFRDAARLVLVDSSPAMVAVARDKIAAGGPASAEAIQADLSTDCPAAIGTGFDAIFSSMVLHHVDELAPLLGRLHDLLATDGRLVVVDIDSDDGVYHRSHGEFSGLHGFEQDQLLHTVSDAGFGRASARTFYRGRKTDEHGSFNYSLFLLTADRSL